MSEGLAAKAVSATESLYDLSGLPDFVKESPGYEKAFHSGSRVICDPPVMNTDNDYFVFMSSNLGPEYADGPTLGSGTILKMRTDDDYWMRKQGFEMGGSSDKNAKEVSMFKSWKKGDLNLIMTRNLWWYEKSLMATKVCKQLNLLKKEDRVMVFAAIREGIEP